MKTFYLILGILTVALFVVLIGGYLFREKPVEPEINLDPVPEFTPLSPLETLFENCEKEGGVPVVAPSGNFRCYSHYEGKG